MLHQIGTALIYVGAACVVITWLLIVSCGFAFSLSRGIRDLLFPIFGFKDAGVRFPYLIWILVGGLGLALAGSFIR